MKSNIKKGLIIFLSIAAAVLIVWGIIVKLTQPSRGTEKVLSTVSSLENVVRSQTESLTEEQFVYGVQNILPQCKITDKEQTDLVYQLKKVLSPSIKDSFACEFVNWFGEPAVSMELPYYADLSLLSSTLQQFPSITHAFINIYDDSYEVVQCAEYADGHISGPYGIPEVTASLSDQRMKLLAGDLNTEFGLSADSLCFDDTYTVIDVTGIQPADCIDLFDMVYQRFCNLSYNTVIVLKRGNQLEAYADMRKYAELYKAFYTESELAPLFRMTYYFTCNFFKNDLWDYSKTYL